jgi:hypothetical protein
MKVYEIKYTGISMGFLIMPQAYVEDEQTQRWFKEFDIPPVEAIELDPSKVKLGSKSLQEIEQENMKEDE